jgi:hypothetical protein
MDEVLTCHLREGKRRSCVHDRDEDNKSTRPGTATRKGQREKSAEDPVVQRTSRRRSHVRTVGNWDPFDAVQPEDIDDH